MENNAHVDFNDKNFDNVRFVKLNSEPADGEHLTAKYYVDNAFFDSVCEPILVGKNQDNDFNIYVLANINSIALNTQAVNDIQVITESYVDQYHQENERSGRN